MARPVSLEQAQLNREKLIQGMSETRRGLARFIERSFVGKFRASPEQLYGVVGHEPHQELRQAVARALHKHPDIKMSHAEIAAYLHTSEQEVRRYLVAAETLIVSRAGSPASNDALACFQLFGPAVGRILTMVA